MDHILILILIFVSDLVYVLVCGKREDVNKLIPSYYLTQNDFVFIV